MLEKHRQKNYVKPIIHNWEQEKPNLWFDLDLNMLHISLNKQELYRHIIIKILASALNRQFLKMIVIYLGKRSTQEQKRQYFILSFLDTILSKKFACVI